jgi:hypothetical protein
MIAMTASRMITAVIEATTERVTPFAEAVGVGQHAQAVVAGDKSHGKAEHRRLADADPELTTSTAWAALP